MRITGGVSFVMVCALALGACGGGGGSGGGDPEAKPASTEAFCAQARKVQRMQDEADAAGKNYLDGTADPEETRAALREVEELARIAPAAIAADTETLVDVARTWLGPVDTVGGDPGVSALTYDPKYADAMKRFEAYLKDECGIEDPDASGKKTPDSTAPARTGNAKALTPSGPDDGLRMLAAFLGATYGSEDRESAPGTIFTDPLLRPPAVSADGGIDVDVFANGADDLTQACATFAPAAGYFMQGASYRLTLTGLTKQGEGIGTATFQPLDCPLAPASSTDPVAATRPAAPADRAAQAIAFLRAYVKPAGWFKGDSRSSVGAETTIGISVLGPDPTVRCGEIAAVTDWFMGDAPYRLRVQQFTTSSDGTGSETADPVDCPR